MKLFSNVFSSLEKGLEYSTLKQKVISQNISNVDTPNYKAKTVSFQDALSNANDQLRAIRTNPRHFHFEPHSNHHAIKANNNVQYNHNGNSVDVDQEMADLAKNQIYYNALVERLNGKFQSLQSVIKGGQ